MVKYDKGHLFAVYTNTHNHESPRQSVTQSDPELNSEDIWLCVHNRAETISRHCRQIFLLSSNRLITWPNVRACNITIWPLRRCSARVYAALLNAIPDSRRTHSANYDGVQKSSNKKGVGKFHKTSNKKCGCVQYMQGGTCLSRQHNLHAGAFKEETSRSRSKSRREVSVLHLQLTN